DLVNWVCLHLGRILASPQRRRDAWRHGRRNVPDETGRGSMNMAAENGDHSSGALQGLPKPRHRLRRFEVETVRPHHDLKGRMMGEDCDWLGRIRFDHVDQVPDALAAKIAFVAG